MWLMEGDLLGGRRETGPLLAAAAAPDAAGAGGFLAELGRPCFHASSATRMAKSAPR